MLTFINLILLTRMLQVQLINFLQSPSSDPAKDSATEIKHSEDGSSTSIALGTSIMLLGLLAGAAWAWLRFFRRGKSPRGGITINSGQVCIVDNKSL